ncbi:terminase large subunit domain-containing protein [Sinorhizobium meliloti]|uniref:terminase large subunit domain-containing protein n=1 Tax=Rhizobium meliloti TaxID=382 RepID=UPI001F1B9113|nr:terminase family protein [Sinorhizobium meliloti]
MAGAEQGRGAQTIIRPQPRPQTAFLASPADIAIYGGSAGGGKTWALLMEPLRHIANPQFGAVFFRRSTVQVRNEGGLWDESETLYPAIGASPLGACAESGRSETGLSGGQSEISRS